MSKTEFLKITTAARDKGVSRASVYFAIANGVLDAEKIGGTLMIVDNNKFRQWTPGKLKGQSNGQTN